MGIPANPSPQSQLPQKLFNDEELRPYFTVLQEDMYRLWLRSGGGTDQVSEIVIDLDAINVRLDTIETRLDVIEAELAALDARVTYLEGTLIVTAVNVTASGNTTIICTAALTVTLAATPLDKDLVSIKASNGDKIIIDSNGKTIEGQAIVTIRKNSKNTFKTGLTMRYSADLSLWVLV